MKTFANLYAALISAQRPPDFAVYKSQIFGTVGLLTLGLALLLVLVYYYLFNSPPTLLGRAWHRTGQWALTLALAAGAAAWLAYSFASSVPLEGGGRGVEHTQYLGYFLVVNALLAAVWFLVLSLLLKFRSPQARTTPVAWPRFSR